MADTSLGTEILKAVPVVLGGLLAVFGGVAGQYFTHRFTQTREAEKLLREKAEQFIHALYAHRAWLDAKDNATLFHHSDHDVPSPLDQGYALQSLYFPELRPQLDAIRRAEIQLVHFIFTQLQRQREMEPQAWLAQREQHIAEWRPMYDVYIKASEAAVATIVTAVQQRLGA
jgi:hypothetical protein